MLKGGGGEFRRLFLLCLVGVLAGCLGPMSRRGKPSPEVPPVAPETMPVPGQVEIPGEIPGEVPAVKKGRMVAVWAPGMKADALGSAQYLSQRPWMKVTALFPEHFFDDEKSRQAKALFQTLVSSHQVEVVLTLPDQPVLPLIMDTMNARVSSPTVAALPPAFSWPEDVVEQVGLARKMYRTRWHVSPTGILLPWGVALGPEFPLLAKYNFDWAVLPASGSVPTWIEGFNFPVLRPGVVSAAHDGIQEGAMSQAMGILVSSGTVGPIQVSAVEELGALEEWVGSTNAWDWAFLSEAVKDGFPLVARATAAPVDFTPWIGDEEENRAWDLLGIARRSVNDYQNSGLADLKSLDLAKRTLYGAENGAYFDHFGAEKEGARGEDVLRDFTATLAQVYPILGLAVPPEIRQGFSRQGTLSPRGEEPSGVFERDQTVLRWRDTLHDDRGPGDYFYPTGLQFPPGSWDLLRFEVEPTNTEVTFVFGFDSLTNPGRGPNGFSLPLVDLYIDINHSAGAGSQEFLPGRPGMTEAADAWEYALSADGWGAEFYQFVPGRDPRLVATFSVVKTTDTAFAVTVPRRYFRGDPESWGYAVAVMGRASGGTPMRVEEEPGADHFGGGLPGVEAPPYIDLLVPTGHSQRRILGAYRSGQNITIPFVRVE